MAATKKSKLKGKQKKVKVIDKTRKQQRKEKRKEKKAVKALYYQNKHHQPGKFVLNLNKSTIYNQKNIKQNKAKSSDIIHDRLQIKYEKEKKEQAKLKQEVAKNRQKQLEEDNIKEDKIIKQLEKKLKLNKRKSKTIPKSFMSDGLDYLLDICNEGNRKLVVETEKQLLGADFDLDFETDNKERKLKKSGSKVNTSKLNNKIAKSKDTNLDEINDTFSDSDDLDNYMDIDMESDLSNEIDEDLSASEMDEEADSRNRSKQQTTEKNNLEKKLITSNDEDTNSVSEITDKNENNSEKDKGVWEDIYGRKRDAGGNIITENTGKYIPPAARFKESEKYVAKSEKLSRLKRQLKGLMNRLSEHNMHAIVSQIEDLYMSNSRNDMNVLLSKLTTEALVGPTLKPNCLFTEHIMLMAILHANVGNEVGAHFLQYLVKLYDEMSKIQQKVENKELDSIILMISQLYNFKVIGSRLLYQILERLTEKFEEKEIELTLLILRTVGFSLRKDDPLALKSLIFNLKRKATGTESNNLRVKFMLETMLAIQHNNMKKIPQYDSHTEHIKKLLKGFLRRGNTVTQFDIGLNDLLKAEERGRWWIVGSAWTGKEDVKDKTSSEDSIEPSFSSKLLELARKQRMNTDTRKNIFCTLMTAEDYVDASEKLYRFVLKGQEKDVVHVIMDCCFQEKEYNPYYSVLAKKLCNDDRQYKREIQFALWKKLENLKNYTNKQMINLSRFLTHLFIEKELPLSVLQVVQLGELDKYTMKFLRHIILGILLHDNVEDCLQVFEKITFKTELHHFKEGLRLFINHFLVKSGVVAKDKIELLKQRTELVNTILTTRNAKVTF